MDIVIDGNHYTTSGNMDAFTQLHVTRKLSGATGAVDGLLRKENEGKNKSLLTVIMFSYLDDTDTEYVIKKCLSVVLRKDSAGKPARVLTKDGQLMFADISMSALLEITMAVVEENLGDFFRMSLSALAQPNI